MNVYAQLKVSQQSRAVANTSLRKGPDIVAPGRQLNRLGSLQERANLNPAVRHVAQMQQVLNAGPRASTPLKRKENQTGLPDHLKAGIERLSNLSLDDVKVQYNSSRPAQFQALAITQGKDIHVGPGQEHHLPHEAWHLVQQKQGRVRPTMQMRGTAINDDSALEREADVMGALAGRATQPDQHDHAGNLSRAGHQGLGTQTSSSQNAVHLARAQVQPVAQRVVMAIPDTHPTQYRSTLIAGQTFPSAAAAQAAEQAGMAAIEAERQRLQQEREQQAEAERQAAEAELERRRAERNPQFAPPLYHHPFAMNNPLPPQPIFPLLAARQIGAHNQHQLQAQAERLEQRREMEGVDPQLHQFLPDRYGDLGEI